MPAVKVLFYRDPGELPPVLEWMDRLPQKQLRMREVFNLTQRYGPVDPQVRAEIRQHLDIAQKVYDLRTERGLTQAELAALVSKPESVIRWMEDADYDLPRSLRVLERITVALGFETSAPLSSAGTAAA